MMLRNIPYSCCGESVARTIASLLSSSAGLVLVYGVGGKGR